MIIFFIDENRHYYRRLIEFEHFVNKYTRKKMAILIKNILKRNDILRKILTIIINNAFNNNIFIKSLIHYFNIKTLTSA